MNKKEVIKYLILVVLCMIVIFSFSNQTGKASQNLSDKISIEIIEIKSKITNRTYTKKEAENLVKEMRFFVRKTAHFFLYFILGILLCLLFEELKFNKKIRCILLVCLLCALSDEIHQMFVSERTAKVLDVFIDLSGSIFAIFIKSVYNTRLVKKKNYEK